MEHGVRGDTAFVRSKKSQKALAPRIWWDFMWILPWACVLSVACVSAHGTIGEYVWAKQIGGGNLDTGYSLAVDSTGSVYITGAFEGTADFDPGAGTANRTAVGAGDVFVSKLDSSGAFVWAAQMGGNSDERGYSVAVDPSGNVYVTGYFEGTVDFDPGEGVANLTAIGGRDIFVSKLDSTGAFIWARQFGGSGTELGLSLAVDFSGNIYTTGMFSGGTVDFDPGADTAILTPLGLVDTFVSKLDSSGAFVWVKQMGGTSSEWGQSVAVDSDGNVCTTGFFYGTADFDPGVSTAALTASGGSDIFVSKLDTLGAFVWAKQMGGSNDEKGLSLAVDASGNVYTTGYFYDTADFDPGVGTAYQTAFGESDIYVSKLDSSGNFVWAKQIGGTGEEESYSIAVDDGGNVYTSGSFEIAADFDPDEGAYNLTPLGDQDIFVSNLDSSGRFVSAIQMGGSVGAGDAISLALDSGGNVYLTGFFDGTVDFDPGSGTAALTADWDVFVVKLGGLSPRPLPAVGRGLLVLLALLLVALYNMRRYKQKLTASGKPLNKYNA